MISLGINLWVSVVAGHGVPANAVLNEDGTPLRAEDDTILKTEE